MPTLDVTEILHHAELVDNFLIRRRHETVDIHGRSVVAETTYSVNGVVTSGSPNDMDRVEDYERASRSLTIVCQFRLRTVTDQYQPDIVVWRGDNYVVNHVDSYPQFGAGFFEAECTSMDKIDQPLDPLPGGRLLSNQINGLNIRALMKP